MSDSKDKNVYEFHVDAIAQGRITPRALLEVTGTISVPLVREFLTEKTLVLIPRLAGDGWFFNIGYQGGKFVLQRNNGQITIDDEWCAHNNPPDMMLVSWQLDALILSFGTHSTHWDFPQLVVHSDLLVRPPGLIKWVRAQELTNVESFDSEEQFVIRVHSTLQRFDERLRPLLNRDFFWDVERRGNKIIRRSPKREVEIQSVLHAMLVDHMQLSSIEILPEVRSPAGSVDFLFQCSLTTGGIAKVCVEFKNAHSPDLMRGLSQQLRRYMKQLEVNNGAYCVLDYHSSELPCSADRITTLMAQLASEDLPDSKWPNRPIKIHWFELGGAISPN